MTLNEVAPPGFGHTKGDKKKGVKRGGTAAAFDRARKEGRFKGSKSDMFAIMWSQKNKGDKPHYKPGTDKKYKKYQEEGLKHEVDGEKYLKLPKKYKKIAKHKGDYRSALGKAKDAITDKLGKTNTDRDGVKDSSKRIFTMQNSYEPAGKVVDEAVKGQDESFEIDKTAHKAAQKKQKMRNLAKGNTNPNEKSAAEKKAGGPKLMGEGKKWDSYKKAVATVLGKKKEERKPQKATDAGARAKRLLQRKVHAKYVSGSEDLVPDEIRD